MIVAAHNNEDRMLYTLHEAAYNSATPVLMAARAARDFWSSPLNPASASKWGRTLYALPTWSPT